MKEVRPQRHPSVEFNLFRAVHEFGSVAYISSLCNPGCVKDLSIPSFCRSEHGRPRVETYARRRNDNQTRTNFDKLAKQQKKASR